jgi:hypothetical protein
LHLLFILITVLFLIILYLDYNGHKCRTKCLFFCIANGILCSESRKCYRRLKVIIIIISADRRLLLDIGLPQSSPRRSVLFCLHPATSRDLQQIVGPPCGGPTNAASPGTRSLFEDLSAPTAVSPPRNVPYSLPLEVCNSSGYVGDLSSFTDLVISDSNMIIIRHIGWSE